MTDTRNDKWLDTFPNGCFHTNQEIINNPQYKPSGWFNPFTEPDKLVEELQHFKTAKDIKEHIEMFYPGIDPKPYQQKKVDENKQRDIKYCCTTWIWKWNPAKQKYDKTPRRCKHWNDCPHCKEWKLKQNQERLEKLIGKVIVVASTKKEEKKIKANRSQSDYLRIPRDDGTTVFILKDEEGDNLVTPQMVEELKFDMMPNEERGRFSGNLGKAMVGGGEDDTEGLEPVEVKAYMIRFTEESTIDDNKELEAKVLEQIDSTEMPTSVEAVQERTKEADKVLEKVCIEYKIDKQFLYRETIYVSMKEIEYWWKVKKE